MNFHAATHDDAGGNAPAAESSSRSTVKFQRTASLVERRDRCTW
jgi:hypothetical protein